MDDDLCGRHPRERSGETCGSLRINVAVTPECLEALERVMAAEQVSLTEAVRRLVSYGDFVYLSAKVEGAELLWAFSYRQTLTTGEAGSG